MLLKFYCSNFKSIKNEIEFSMFAGSYKRHESHLVKLKDQSVLRSSAIYGANGSGKTNLLVALHYLHKLVVQGTRDINEQLNVPTFKLSDCRHLPTRFEIDFLIENKRFNYILEITENAITREELFEVREKSEVIIFKRRREHKKTYLTIAPNKDKNPKEKLREEIYSEELRENQPFFFEAINKKIAEAQLPHSWFRNKLKFMHVQSEYGEVDHVTPGLASTFLSDKEFLEASKDLISQAKVGITDFQLSELSLKELKSRGFNFPFPQMESDLLTRSELNIDFTFQGELYSSFRNANNEIRFVKISTTHEGSKGEAVQFKFAEESKGVQKLFFLLPVIYRSIHKGEIFIIDEIETSFHPALLKEVLKLFLDTTAQNPGQIIFTTHESNLLDLELFRQDEIWFCEKDNEGGTKLYSLGEFKPRFDKDIRKGYLEGQFSYIPFLGDATKLAI